MVNFSTRKTLFGSKKHKLKASLHTEQSSRRNFIFTIDFLDACRSAKINEQTVKPWSPIYRAHKETVDVAKHQAFTDTVDQTSTYSKGICGEKVFALDPETTPKFISVVKTNEKDPINSDIEIRYDPALAKHDDVTVVFEIKFSVSFKEFYSELSDPIQGKFSFKILCPPKVPLEDSELKTPISFSNAYDIADPDKMVIKVQDVKLKPVACFSVTTYLVHLKGKPQITPGFIKLAKDQTGFEIDTNDRAVLGWYELTTKVQANNDE